MKRVVLSAALLWVGCTGEATVLDGGAAGAAGGRSQKGDRSGTIAPDLHRDVVHTALDVDLSTRTAVAHIQLAGSQSDTASFEAGGLRIDTVSDAGGPLAFEELDGWVHVQLREAGEAPEIDVAYAFQEQPGQAGLIAGGGSTVTWPTFCGNLFPCRSDPADGVRFTLALRGVPPGAVAIYPSELSVDVPAYTLAWAVGAYTCEDLGSTGAGTAVRVCWLPRGKTKALKGTRKLVAVMDWLETTLGPYAFGDEVATVAVDWGESGAGGMEHHPYWHVAVDEMDDPLTHAHEAAHGWFGAGVRIGCWEDFVLSEGTVSYLAARALGAAEGEGGEDWIWEGYRDELAATLEDEDRVVWPQTCGQVDLLRDGLFSNLVYMKGAFFYRALGQIVGPGTVDAILAELYKRRVGQAARMQDVLDLVREATGLDPTELADHWLRSLGDPFASSPIAPTH